MIKDLDFIRNAYGLYQITRSDLESYTITHCVKSNLLSVCSNIFWITDSQGKRFLVKKYKDRKAGQKICGELLFSMFCKRNNIPCADIDVSMIENYPGIISADVCNENEYVEAFDFCVFEEKIRNSTKYAKTAQEVYKHMIEGAKREDLELDENAWFSIQRMAIIDWLVGQTDRHPGNFMVMIDHSRGKQVLKMCPLIDNEFAFCFINLKLENEDFKYLNSFNYPQNMKKFLEGESINSNLCVPRMGIITETACDEKYIKGNANFLKEYRETHADCLKMAKEIASLMKRDKRLKDMYLGLDLDIDSMVDQIRNETGYKIPNFYKDYAKLVVEKRRKLLDNVLGISRNSEPGEE